MSTRSRALKPARQSTLKQRDEKRDLRPPFTKTDRRVLGFGSSKFAWRIQPTNQTVVVNSFDSQIIGSKPEGWKFTDWFRYYMKRMKQEYLFTVYVQKKFGDLIPRVALFEKGLFPDRKFRYQKEFCKKIHMDEPMLQYLFTIEDYLLDHGWVYLDMKPSNLGIREDTNGRHLCLVDTDPAHFYQVPDVWNVAFRNAAYMILLLTARDYLPAHVLRKAMDDRGLSMNIFRKTYEFFTTFTDKDLDNLVDYGNERLAGDPDAREPLVGKPFRLTSVTSPKDFLDTYGNGDLLGVLERLCLDEKPESIAEPGSIPTVKLTVKTVKTSMKPSVKTVKTSMKPSVKPGEKPRARITAKNNVIRGTNARGTNEMVANEMVANEMVTNARGTNGMVTNEMVTNARKGIKGTRF